MKIKSKMFYLGKKYVDNSGKTNDKGLPKSSYYMVRMEDENDNLYEWYVPEKDNDMMVDQILKAEKYKEYQVLLEVSAYQGKPRIDLVGMAK